MSFFTVSGLGSFTSPFGELLSKFIVNLSTAYETPEEKCTFLRRLVRSLPRFATPIAVVYLMQGIATFADTSEQKLGAWGGEELATFRSLLEGEMAITVWSSSNKRRLLRKYFGRAVGRFGDVEDVSIAELVGLVGVLFDEEPIRVEMEEFGVVKGFMGDVAGHLVRIAFPLGFLLLPSHFISLFLFSIPKRNHPSSLLSTRSSPHTSLPRLLPTRRTLSHKYVHSSSKSQPRQWILRRLMRRWECWFRRWRN